MKKLIFACLCGMIALGTAAQTVTRKINVPSFTGISASSIYQITLVKGSSCSVEVVCEQAYEDAIRIRTVGTILEMRLETEMLEKRLRNNMPPIRAVIRMPSLELLHLSGASSLTTEATFDVGRFEARLSGATRAQGLSVNGKEADVIISGASGFEMRGKFQSADFGVSGASHLNADVDAGTFRLGATGASTIKLDLETGRTNFEVSGAASVTATGRADYVIGEVSGASRLAIGAVNARETDLECSGAAAADVAPTERFRVNVSGASSVTYHGDPRMEIVYVSKSSSLRKR